MRSYGVSSSFTTHFEVSLKVKYFDSLDEIYESSSQFYIRSSEILLSLCEFSSPPYIISPLLESNVSPIISVQYDSNVSVGRYRHIALLDNVREIVAR